MADLKRHRNSLVKGLLGHDAPPQKIVLRGMADLEKTLEQRFRQHEKERARLADADAPLQDKLLAVIGKDRRWAAYIRRKRRASRKSRASPRIAPPKVVPPKEHVTLGSLSGTRVPPYDYRWSWGAKTAQDVALETYADVQGSTYVRIITGDEASSASGRAAVGIFFASPSECPSNFRFWANPHFYFDWQEFCSLASAHSDGFVGLFAASYDWGGNFSATLVDQMISLWSHNSWWNDASGSGSGDGFSLSANFQVDRAHWYALWVWCGSYDSGDGFGTFAGSAALSRLSVRVPSITWQVG